MPIFACCTALFNPLSLVAGRFPPLPQLQLFLRISRLNPFQSVVQDIFFWMGGLSLNYKPLHLHGTFLTKSINLKEVSLVEVLSNQPSSDEATPTLSLNPFDQTMQWWCIFAESKYTKKWYKIDTLGAIFAILLILIVLIPLKLAQNISKISWHA